jgi:hypothetical protein
MDINATEPYYKGADIVTRFHTNLETRKETPHKHHALTTYIPEFSNLHFLSMFNIGSSSAFYYSFLCGVSEASRTHKKLLIGRAK